MPADTIDSLTASVLPVGPILGPVGVDERFAAFEIVTTVLA